jgi:hypothetical protein
LPRDLGQLEQVFAGTVVRGRLDERKADSADRIEWLEDCAAARAVDLEAARGRWWLHRVEVE